MLNGNGGIPADVVTENFKLRAALDCSRRQISASTADVQTLSGELEYARQVIASKDQQIAALQKQIADLQAAPRDEVVELAA